MSKSPKGSDAVTVFMPHAVTEELLAKMRADGYVLPPEWPAPALAALDMTSSGGWDVQTTDNGSVYVAPDGSKFARAARGSEPTLVGLSKKGSPVPLNLLPGEARPEWLPVHKHSARARRAVTAGTPGTGRKVNLADAELRDVLSKMLDTLGDVGNMSAVKLLRAEGRKVSNERTRAMLDVLRAERGPAKAKAASGTTAKREGKKAEVKAAKRGAKSLTRPAPKPTATKRAVRRKSTKSAASTMVTGRKGVRRSR
jgi:hypothetical protein